MKDMKSYKITISGQLGSGKTTVCKILIDKLGYEFVSTGAMQRKIAEKYNMTTVELNRFSEIHKEIDEQIDNMNKEFGKKPENLIIDSRMAWHFIPNSFKVRLTVDPDVAAERIYTDKTRTKEVYNTIVDARRKIEDRRNSETKRYKQLYKVELDDDENFDITVDTTNISAEEVANLILDAFNKWKS